MVMDEETNTPGGSHMYGSSVITQKTEPRSLFKYIPWNYLHVVYAWYWLTVLDQ